VTPRQPPAHRAAIILALLLLGLAVGGARWATEVRPRAEALGRRRAALDRERHRLAATRAELLRLGREGIDARTAALREEVRRREALAPGGSPDAAAAQVRERFAAFASRYGVHAATFEPMPAQTVDGLQVGALTIRAAGSYHALGTWITEALSDTRLLDVKRARLEAVPDSLTRSLHAQGTPAPAPAPPPAAPVPADGTLPPAAAPPGPAAALQLAGAAPLDAVVELVVQWYALPEASAGKGAP